MITGAYSTYGTFFYSVQAQLQSADGQLSDEQHPASHEHSEHPEFALSQPIASAQKAPNDKIAKKFFIFIKYYTKIYLLYPHQAFLSSHSRRLAAWYMFFSLKKMIFLSVSRIFLQKSFLLE